MKAKFKKLFIIMVVLLPMVLIAGKAYSLNDNDEAKALSDDGSYLLLHRIDCHGCGACVAAYPDVLEIQNDRAHFKSGASVTADEANDLVALCPNACFSIINL